VESLTHLTGTAMLERAHLFMEWSTRLQRCGCAVCGRLFSDFQLVHSDGLGRLLVVDAQYNNTKLRLINCYAPTVETHCKVYFTQLIPWITASSLILGDFNMVLSCLLGLYYYKYIYSYFQNIFSLFLCLNIWSVTVH